MRIGKIIGWALLIGAFVFAGAETAAQGIAVSQGGSFGHKSAYTVLSTLLPDFLTALRIFIETNLSPALWDPVITGILVLPGWLTLGVPGIFLAWKCRDLPLGGVDSDDDIMLTTSYEDIMAAAEEADEYGRSPPSKYKDLDDFDPARSSDD
ncbi:MAG: hypothetical protein QGG84_02790 [Rhodospirillales bacterium]|jgi:hypothetical protein|nr:hypothetical protein [Rhodospirillales bacterium]